MGRIRNMDRDRDATRNSTVPMGLRSFMLTTEIAAKIIPLLKANADAVTKNMIFFTRYLGKRCVDKRNNPLFFRDTLGTPNAFRGFYRGCVANRLIQEMLGRKLEPMERRIACMDNALIQYFTNMKNHIQMNLKKFLIRWLKFYVGMTSKQANDSGARYLNPSSCLVVGEEMSISSSRNEIRCRSSQSSWSGRRTWQCVSKISVGNTLKVAVRKISSSHAVSWDLDSFPSRRRLRPMPTMWNKKSPSRNMQGRSRQCRSQATHPWGSLRPKRHLYGMWHELVHDMQRISRVVTPIDRGHSAIITAPWINKHCMLKGR